MDYILWPCINLYNDMVNASTAPEKIWDTVNKVRQIDKNIKYDNESLQYIFNVFTNALFKLKDKNNVRFALNHDAILLDLASQKYENDQFTLFNIDHHHDIYYSKDAMNEVDKYDTATVANWVWYLDKYHKLKQYYWICNANSTFPEGKVDAFGKMDGLTREKCPQIFDIQEWDYIFVCNSPHWFPRDYDVFFNMLIETYQNFVGNKVKIEENAFSPNGKQRKYPYDKE